jgi:hypothetical protein
MDKFAGGCGLVALKSFPLQLEPLDGKHDNRDDFEKRMDLEKFKGTKTGAHKRLAGYYKELGFKAVRGTDHLMVKAL